MCPARLSLSTIHGLKQHAHAVPCPGSISASPTAAATSDFATRSPWRVRRAARAACSAGPRRELERTRRRRLRLLAAPAARPTRWSTNPQSRTASPSSSPASTPPRSVRSLRPTRTTCSARPIGPPCHGRSRSPTRRARTGAALAERPPPDSDLDARVVRVRAAGGIVPPAGAAAVGVASENRGVYVGQKLAATLKVLVVASLANAQLVRGAAGASRRAGRAAARARRRGVHGVRGGRPAARRDPRHDGRGVPGAPRAAHRARPRARRQLHVLLHRRRPRIARRRRSSSTPCCSSATARAPGRSRPPSSPSPAASSSGASCSTRSAPPTSSTTRAA